MRVSTLRVCELVILSIHASFPHIFNYFSPGLLFRQRLCLRGYLLLLRPLTVSHYYYGMYVAYMIHLLTCAFVPFFLSKEHQNEPSSPVCAFDEKCGELRTFESKNLAILANFTIAHCGRCSYCSNWGDLPFQLVRRRLLFSLVTFSLYSYNHRIFETVSWIWQYPPELADRSTSWPRAKTNWRKYKSALKV